MVTSARFYVDHIYILRGHPLPQHFVVGAGSETFPYLMEIIQKDKRSKSFLHGAGSTGLCHKIYLYNGTCQLDTDSFRSGHFGTTRFTRYSNDVTNLVIGTVIVDSKELSFLAEQLI